MCPPPLQINAIYGSLLINVDRFKKTEIIDFGQAEEEDEGGGGGGDGEEEDILALLGGTGESDEEEEMDDLNNMVDNEAVEVNNENDDDGGGGRQFRRRRRKKGQKDTPEDRFNRLVSDTALFVEAIPLDTPPPRASDLDAENDPDPERQLEDDDRHRLWEVTSFKKSTVIKFSKAVSLFVLEHAKVGEWWWTEVDVHVCI